MPLCQKLFSAPCFAVISPIGIVQRLRKGDRIFRLWLYHRFCRPVKAELCGGPAALYPEPHGSPLCPGGGDSPGGQLVPQFFAALKQVGASVETTSFGSCVFANKPGDGSAREQAASCQKVLGGDANICYEYATKRYRSNCINWGIVPFTISKDTEFQYEVGDMVFVPGIRQAILDGKEEIDAQVITKNGVKPIHLLFQNLTEDERTILADGCLINYYKEHNK